MRSVRAVKAKPVSTVIAETAELHSAFREKSEEWAQAIFAGSAVGIGIVDMEGRFLDVNPAFVRLVGYSVEEMRGMPFTELNHPDDNAANLSLFRELVAGNLPHYQMEKRYRVRDGRVVSVRLTTSLVRDDEGQPRFCIAMVEDTTERKALEARLRHLADHDSLTGLANRALFMERLEEAVRRTRIDPSYRIAVLFVDLDRFKVVNDSLGHQVGDELLRAVGARLREALPPGELIARLGGDEFAVLLEEVDEVRKAVEVADRILATLDTPIDLHGYETFAAATVGIALSDGRLESGLSLLRNADMAMYAARGQGYARHALFDRSMHARALERLQLETDLRHALRREELRVAYQPIVCLVTGRVAALEALVRWEHPVEGIILPDRFIRIAEDTGIILPLGRWVLGESIRQLAEWRAERPDFAAVEMSVNLSMKQLRDAGLVETIAAMLRESGLPPERLKLELTESAVMENAAEAARPLAELKQRGVQLYLDDFGTGYSSLSHLHQLPLEALKIDRSFVRDLASGPDDGRDPASIVRSIVTLARSLGVRVVAEGVETEEQLAAVRGLGCDFGQGYHFSRPLWAPEVEALVGREFAMP